MFKLHEPLQSLHVTRSMPVHHGRVYLSFDDGPDAEWTPRMLDLLEAAKVQATFFMVGCRARAAPVLVRRVLAAGHAVGNHSFSHRHPWTLSAAAARSEVCDGAAALADITGRVPTLFRPPHGRLRRAIYEAAAETAQAIVLWNRSAVDWGPLGEATKIAARLASTEAGDIVLMHDARNRHNKPQELERILPSFLHGLAVQQLKCTRISL